MSKKTIIRAFLSILIIVFFTPALSVSQQVEKVKSIKEITTDIKNTKDVKQRLSLFEKLGKIKPKTAEDVEDIAGVIRSSKEDNEKEYGFEILKNIGEENKHLEKVFLKLLDDPDRDVRTAAIINLGKFKTKEAAPKLREIVKGFSKIDHLKFKTMKYANPQKAYKILYEPGFSAIALGEMKDEESIPIIVEKFEYLEEAGANALSKMGKKGLPYLLELARKEVGSKDHYAENALANISDINAKQDLLNILITEKNRDIRDSVLLGLRRHMFDDEVLDLVKSLYEKEKDILFLSAMRTKKAIPFLIDVLHDDFEDPNNRQYVVSILEEIRDPSVIPVLETVLKDRDLNVRQLALRALIILGDTDTLIRLRDYLKNNLGTFATIEYDRTQLKLIENRIKNGRRGSIIYYEMDEVWKNN